jgi:hypothetical protein
MTKIYFILLLFFCSTVNAETYYPVSFGFLNWSMAGDNWWYQDTHNHEIDKSSNAYSLGIGYKFSYHFRGEANYRYLKGGKISAEWESDVNYFSSAADADHSVSNYGVSSWNVKGVSLDLIYDYDPFYVGAGPFFFREKWKTVHTERGVSEVQTYCLSDKGTGYVFRLGVTYKDLFFEVARFTGIKIENSGVEAATSLNIGYRF